MVKTWPRVEEAEIISTCWILFGAALRGMVIISDGMGRFVQVLHERTAEAQTG